MLTPTDKNVGRESRLRERQARAQRGHDEFYSKMTTSHAYEEARPEASATSSLVSLVDRLRFEELPAIAVDRARMAILDCIGCTLAGAGTEAVRPIAELVLSEGGNEQSTLWGFGRKVPVSAAALVNGTSGHSLDFDDTSPPLIGHPSVPLVPALFAIADQGKTAGRDLITAYVAGFEVETRLGRAMNPPHYAHGWHATSTLGTLGAAVAAAKLMRLDTQGVSDALAIAASSVSGMRDNFGTAIKPMHAGFAARAGVWAALLASRGTRGGRDILDGERGFMSVYAGRAATGEPSLGSWSGSSQELEIATSGIGIKRYACCGCTHTALDAALALRAQHGFTADDIEHVDCGVNSLAPTVLIHHTADTPLEGKFSMEYCLAVGLVDGAVRLAQFTPERVGDPQVQDLLRRVNMFVDADCPVPQGVFPSHVAIQLRDGRRVEARVDEAQGHPDHPLSQVDLDDKFLECASHAIDRPRAESALEHLHALERLEDTRILTDKLA